jgi:diguanylate cyclase (GGDEF)-like protein/PAS domain S-box-containing protein
VETAPVEGTAEGVVIIDGSIAGVGRVKEPVAVRFAGGRAVQVGSSALQELLHPHGPDAFALAGFGIGTNPRATLSGNLVEDEKAIGIAHVSFGAPPGGAVQAPVHASALLCGARVELDGQPLPDKFLTPAAPAAAADLAAIDLEAAETYRILFDNSNDPQAVIDLDTQRFFEVNGGFERLSGFTREDLLGGAVPFSKLVARESYPTYLQKRETRRINPAERYDLKLQTKLGEKKPVELSVRLVKLTGREVVLVSARDLSQRKKIEQEMWAKIEELGLSNSRIFALTEKIRRVPELTPQLLHITDEEALLERTAELLCAREGLAYADVTFYLHREDALELAYSTVRTTKRKLRLTGDNRLARVARGEDPGSVGRRGAVLPLKGRERNIGVMEVAFHPKEIEVLEGNERAMEGYHDLLKTLTNVVGLLVENLHLYETVKRQAIVDALTGTFNRRFFDTKIAEETHRAARYGRHLTLLMIDIDHFADVNNSRGGHPQGDVVLAEIARALRTQTRDVDSVCRYGGDEFAVLMPETPYAGGLGKAESLRRGIESFPFPDVTDPKAKPLKVTLSIGVAGFHPGIKDGDGLLKAADEALYEAKDAGRNAVRGRHPDGPSIPPA